MKTQRFSGAFVVRLGADSDVESRRVEGVVEHVESGRSSQFQSVEALLEFLDGEQKKIQQIRSLCRRGC